MDYGVYEPDYYFIIFSGGKIIYGRFLEQPLLLHGHVAQLNWLHFWTRVSLRLRSTSYIYIYIYICLSSSSLLISSLIQRENLLLQEPCSRRLSTLFTRSLRPSLLLETICLVSLLSFSSINFLYFS